MCIRTSDRDDVKVNSQGLCELCQKISGNRITEGTMQWEDFVEIIQNRYSSSKSRYDCLVPYSGGKDSTYLLYLLSKVPDLHLLAITIDYGFLSDATVTNIKIVLRNLSIDHIMFAPSWKVMENLYKSIVKKTGKLCLVCEGYLVTSLFRLALDLNIPCMASGLIPQQLDDIPPLIQEMDYTYWLQIRSKYIERLSAYLTNKEAFEEFNRYIPLVDQKTRLPDRIFPFVALGYELSEVYRGIREVGWVAPKDVTGISTNCYANHLHMYLEKARHNANALEDHLSALVRDGMLSRDKAIQVMDSDPEEKRANEILCSIGIKVGIADFVKQLEDSEIHLC